MYTCVYHVYHIYMYTCVYMYILFCCSTQDVRLGPDSAEAVEFVQSTNRKAAIRVSQPVISLCNHNCETLCVYYFYLCSKV